MKDTKPDDDTIIKVTKMTMTDLRENVQNARIPFAVYSSKSIHFNQFNQSDLSSPCK
jgi:hypothetical protein